MINLVSMLAVMALLCGALSVIAVMLRDHADAIVAALAGRSIRASVLVTPAPRIRVVVRTPVGRTASPLSWRAAA